MKSLILFTLLVAQGLCEFPRLRQTLATTGRAQPVDDANFRIINGVDAQDNQFPYMVSLNYQGDGHACGASVLTPNWILTAAHCCLTGYPMYVYAGSVVLSSGGQNFDISQYLVHGDYNPDDYWKNDICAVRINGNLPIGDKIQLVNLPPQGWPVNNGDTVLISGWGYTTGTGNQVIPDRMQVGYNFQALSLDNCYQRTGVAPYNGHLCAVGGAPGSATCQGDSGSPLMKDNVQVGIVSFGFMPCGVGYPDYYTRVPEYVNWIQQVLGSEAKDLKIVQQ